jgi:hypothetical protein
LPEESAAAFLRETLPVLDGDELAGIPIRIHSLVARPHPTRPSASPEGMVSFAITMARIPRDDDAVSLMVDQDLFLIERARRYGGQALGQHAFARHAFGGRTPRAHASRGEPFGGRESPSGEPADPSGDGASVITSRKRHSSGWFVASSSGRPAGSHR